MRDSFVFYKSFREAVRHLLPEEQLAVYNAVADYSLDGIEPELSGVAMAVFVLIKPQIDANQKRYENGKKGGRPNQDETKPKPNNNQTITKGEPNVNVNVNENVNENVNVNENERESPARAHEDTNKFTPPDMKELMSYCREEDIFKDFEFTKFMNYYSARGWKGVADWKSLAKTWHSRGHDFGNAGSG